MGLREEVAASWLGVVGAVVEVQDSLLVVELALTFSRHEEKVNDAEEADKDNQGKEDSLAVDTRMGSCQEETRQEDSHHISSSLRLEELLA
jgi:hypothetical protein